MMDSPKCNRYSSCSVAIPNPILVPQILPENRVDMFSVLGYKG